MNYLIMLFSIGLSLNAAAQANEQISGELAKRVYELMETEAQTEDEDESTIESMRNVNYLYVGRSTIVQAVTIGSSRTNQAGENFTCYAPSANPEALCMSSHSIFPAGSGGLSARLYNVLKHNFDLEQAVTNITIPIQRIRQGYRISHEGVSLTCTSRPGNGLAAVQVESCSIERSSAATQPNRSNPGLGACTNQVKSYLHRRTARSSVTIASCQPPRSNQVVCLGYATNDDGGSIDFTFGVRPQTCAVSFYRETARE